MSTYQKSVITVTEGLAEGVYAASGAVAGGGVKCDSQYMNGNWQKPDYSDWNGINRGYKQQFGCLGCPAYRDTGCGLQSDYIASENAESYNQDNGNRMPSWERKGYQPDDTVTDWNM